MYKLPITKILIGAFFLVGHYRKVLLANLLFPLLVQLGVVCAWSLLLARDAKSLSFMSLIFFAGIAIVFYSTVRIAILTHRVILMRPLDANNPIFTRRDWSFLKLALSLALLGTTIQALAIPATIFPAALYVFSSGGERSGLFKMAFEFGVIPATYFVARMSLAAPAIAIDRPMRVKDSWKLSMNNGWRLAVVIGAFPLLLSLALRVLPKPENIVFASLIEVVLAVLAFVISVAALSLSYKELLGDQIK